MYIVFEKDIKVYVWMHHYILRYFILKVWRLSYILWHHTQKKVDDGYTGRPKKKRDMEIGNVAFLFQLYLNVGPNISSV